MTREVEIKPSLDEEGNQYFPVAHVNGIIGIEEVDVSAAVQINTDEINALKVKVEQLEIKDLSLQIAINELVASNEQLQLRVQALEGAETE